MRDYVLIKYNIMVCGFLASKPDIPPSPTPIKGI